MFRSLAHLKTHLIGIGTPLAAGLSRIVENASFGLVVINWPVFDKITECA